MLNTSLAFLLEKDIANRKRLVNNQNIWLGNSRNCKGNTSNHTRGEILQWHVNKITEFCKLNNPVEIGIDKLLGISKERSIKVDILTSRQLGIKARTKLNKRGNVTVNLDVTLTWF